MSKLLSGTSVQADKPAAQEAAKPVPTEVKAPEQAPDPVPEGGIQDRVNKLLKSTSVQAK